MLISCEKQTNRAGQEDKIGTTLPPPQPSYTTLLRVQTKNNKRLFLVRWTQKSTS
jgi:hypothetical protein